MKRAEIRMSLFRFFTVLAALLLFASAALYAEFNAGYYAEERGGGSIHQSAPPAFASGATYDAGAYPLFPPSLPPGAGRDEVMAFCNTCHSPRYITMQPPLPPETWAGEVNKMIKTYGAFIPDDSTVRIIRYLQTNFSVATGKE